jgi:hypothetical protein
LPGNSDREACRHPRRRALYHPRHLFFNLDVDAPWGQDCFAGGEHAYGTGSDGSAFILPLADDLLDSRLYRNVLIVPIAVGGTYIEEWRADGGRYFPRFERAIKALQGYGLTPTAVLWHQGEGNATPLVSGHSIGRGGSLADTRAFLVTPQLKAAAQAGYVRLFWGAPIFVARATTCGFKGAESAISAAQSELPDPRLGIVAGPDTDLYGDRYRLDRCHFNAEGIRLVASAFAMSISAFEVHGSGSRLGIPTIWRRPSETTPARHR